MNRSQINQAIAECCGAAHMFVMVKHGLYYRPDECGYTGEISLAGRWPKDDACKLEGSKGYPDEVKAIPAPVPDYCALDAMAEAEKTLTEEEYEKWLVEVAMATRREMDHGGPRSYVSATALQRAEAFLRVKNLWRDWE